MIKFPQLHIASSVVNRILNISDELDGKLSSQGEVQLQPAPKIKDDVDVEIEGDMIDEATSSTLEPAEPSLDLAGAIAGSSHAGSTALQGFLDTLTA